MKLAVIGAGHMGTLHAEKFAARSDARVVAVADSNAARAEALARKLGCGAFTDYREAIGSADAATVAVPTERHFEIASACLQAGLNVLVEKPIASSVQQARDLIALAAKGNLVLQVGHVERYNTTFRTLAARMTRPLFVEAERLSGFKQRGADVDVVLDLMIHDFDLAIALSKSRVTDVSACGFRVLTGDIDIANARVEFANGCVANLSASRVSQAPVRKLRVFQTDLYASADLQAGKLRYVSQAKGAINSIEETHEKGDALAEQARVFVASVSEKKPAQVSGEDGLRALELALSVGRLVRERLAKFG